MRSAMTAASSGCGASNRASITSKPPAQVWAHICMWATAPAGLIDECDDQASVAIRRLVPIACRRGRNPPRIASETLHAFGDLRHVAFEHRRPSVARSFCLLDPAHDREEAFLGIQQRLFNTDGD